MGKFSLKPSAGPNQRREILKRGVLGIAAVVLVAFAVSFLGGGDGAQNVQSQRPSEPESKPLDARALLEAEPDAPAQAATPIPANRKFDYAAGDSGSLTVADAPIAVAQPQPTPAENSGNVEVTEPASSPLPIPATAPAAVNDAPQSAEPVPAENPQTAKTAGAVLYCGNFGTSQSAEERKAMLAFQGKSSAVVKHGSGYALKIGPFKNRDAAREEFSKLDAAGLVTECSLEDNQ